RRAGGDEDVRPLPRAARGGRRALSRALRVDPRQDAALPAAARAGLRLLPEGRRVRRARVLIVDDSTFVRRTLRRVLDAEADLSVIGEAGDGREALDKVRALKPDLVTLDLQMPGMDGMTALRELKEMWPHLPVLVFASAAHDRGAVVFEALALGA